MDDHAQHHCDDGHAVLRPSRALNLKLFVRVLLHVQHVGAEDGGQIAGGHLVASDLEECKHTRGQGVCGQNSLTVLRVAIVWASGLRTTVNVKEEVGIETERSSGSIYI